jgi:hypothetical protein
MDDDDSLLDDSEVELQDEFPIYYAEVRPGLSSLELV